MLRWWGMMEVFWRWFWGLGFLGWVFLGVGCGGREVVEDAGVWGEEEVIVVVGEGGLAWEAAGMFEQGEVLESGGVVTVGVGEPMSGVRFLAPERGWPVVDYVLTFEAQRVRGGDFFCGVTFPVWSEETCVTLILGGWGGGLVGISSIDYADASENGTRTSREFENGKWYPVRVEVRAERLKVWVEDRLMVNVNIGGRILGLRPGEIEKCAPVGVATWRTVGAVRKMEMRRLVE